jgi:hypothetical protein
MASRITQGNDDRISTGLFVHNISGSTKLFSADQRREKLGPDGHIGQHSAGKWLTQSLVTELIVRLLNQRSFEGIYSIVILVPCIAESNWRTGSSC